MVYLYRIGLCGLFLLFTATGLQADSWASAEEAEFHSPNRKHILRVTPDKNWPGRMGGCLGELYRIEGNQRKLVWKRFLVNNHAPVEAMVTDSGRYVVTLDEWGEVGKLPVVIYGWRGELITVHSLESLGARSHLGQIECSISSIWWRNDALLFFGPEETCLFIRPTWGNTLMISLERGEVMTDE